MKQYKKTIPAFVILIFGIIISIGVKRDYKKSQLEAIDNEIDLLIENKIGSIQHGLTTSFSSLEFLKNIIAQNTDLTREDFFYYANPFLKGVAGTRALSWVPKVKLEDRAKYESQLQKELESNLTIWNTNKDNIRFVAQNRPIYFPVTFIEPIKGNYDAIGYDIFSSGTRKATVLAAVEKKELLITSRIKLVQDTVGFSFLGILPVFQQPDKETQINESIDTLAGVVSGVYKVAEIIDATKKLSTEYQFDLVIFDVSRKIEEIIYGDEKLLTTDVKILKRELLVGGRTWEINFLVNSKYYEVKEAWVYLLVGVSGSLFLFILFLLPFIREERSRRLSLKLDKEKEDRKVAEQTLSESEEYNRALFSQSLIGLALTDMDGKLVDINPSYANIIGRTIEETKKLSYWDITPNTYNEQEKIQLESLNTKGEYGPYIKEYIHKDGHLVPVRLKGKIIKQKNVKYIWSSVEDITEQKKAESELVRLNQILKETGEIAKIGGWEFNVESGVYSATDEVAKIYDTEPGLLKKIVGQLKYYTPESRDVIHKSLDRAVKKQKPFAITLELQSVKNIHKWVKVIGKPLINQGKVVKVRGSIQDITEEKKAEIEIANSEKRFRNMFNNALFGAVINQLIRDDSGNAVDFLHLDVNDATELHLGFKPELIIGKLASELVSEEEANYSIKQFAEVVNSGKSCKFEKHYDAFNRTVEISAFHLSDDLFITTFIDISERKKYEKALTDSEKKFRALVEQSLTGIYIFQKDKFLYANKRFCEIFGYTENEILTQLKPTDVVTREEKSKADENINKRLSGEIDSVRYIARGKHKTNKELWIEIHGTHIEYEGNDVITGTVLDITQRKIAEEKINNLNLVLEEKVDRRTKELNNKLQELERLNKLFINREFRIKELKDKIKEIGGNK